MAAVGPLGHLLERHGRCPGVYWLYPANTKKKYIYILQIQKIIIKFWSLLNFRGFRFTEAVQKKRHDTPLSLGSYEDEAITRQTLV